METNNMVQQAEEKVDIEASLGSLDQLIRQLEDPQTGLDEAFKAYSQGMELVKKCTAQIDLIEKKVLTLNEDGETGEL